jgi:nitric oxide reductase large subunit
MQTSLMQFFRWMRVFGDTIFAVGAVAFVWFALKLIFVKPKPEALPAGEGVKA